MARTPVIGDAFPTLLQAARTGADWAWERIYEELAPLLLGYLRARGATDPEDLVGEVFLQVVRDLHTFEGSEDAFRGWIFSIAYHRLIDDRRYHGRRPERLEDTAGVGDPASDDVASEVAHRMDVDAIRRTLDRLSDDQADVLVMRIIAGFTIPEIAEATGKRIGAVKALQRRGLKALERILSDEGVPF